MSSAAGFHYVSQSSGTESETIVGDAGASGGRQVITFNTSFGTEQFTLLLVGATVYFEGNAPAIEDELGVSAARATALQGKWVTVSAGDGPYTALQPGITVASQAQEIEFVPASTSNVTTQDGTSAYRIAGSVFEQGGTAAAHLDITTSTHQALAFAIAATAGGGANTVTFTNWGTAPTVAAPSGAVAWSTLGSTPPPGGYGQTGTGGVTVTPTPTGQGTI